MPAGVIVLGHGSRRQEANQEIIALADMVQANNSGWQVSWAFVEFAEPTLEQTVARLAAEGAVREAVVVPLFLTVGNHLHQNLPQRLAALRQAYPQLSLRLAGHIGADPLLRQLIENRVRQLAGQ